MADGLIDDPLDFITELGSKPADPLPPPGGLLDNQQEDPVEDSGGNPDAPEPPDEEEDFFADDEGAPYVDWLLTDTLVCNEGVIQSGVASDEKDAESIVTQVSAPVWERHINYRTARDGTQPKLPSFKALESEQYVCKTRFYTATKVPLGNGKGYTWSFSCGAVYAVVKPKDPEKEGFSGCASPAITDTPEDVSVPADVFRDDLLE